MSHRCCEYLYVCLDAGILFGCESVLTSSFHEVIYMLSLSFTYHVRNKTAVKLQILKYGRCSADASGQKLYLNQSGCDTIRGSSVRLLSSQFKMSRFCMDVSHPLNIDSCIAKRHTSTTRTKQRRRPVDKKREKRHS